MEYLIQFQVFADDLICDDFPSFNYNGMEIRLYLHNKSWISPGKKVHFMISAETWEKAFTEIQNCRSDLQHRLMFLTNEPITIYFRMPELIIWNQKGRHIRDIHFWDLRHSGVHHLDTTYIDHANEIFEIEIEEADFLAMGFYNEALQSNLPTCQFRALYLALEKIIKTNTIAEKAEKCEKCGATLNLSAKNKQIDDFFAQQENDISTFGANNYPKGKELRKLRGQLSHPPNKPGIINSHDLDENIKVLSRLVRCHLEKKFQLGYTAYAISKPWGTFQDFQAKFNTKHPEENFAIEDIPPVEELKNNTIGTRWIKS